jgi:uncharacterized membrane protein YgcG
MKKLLLTLTILFVVFFIKAQEIPDREENFVPIYDEVGLLNSTQKLKLTKKISSIEDSNAIQIQIIIIDSLKEFSVEQYVKYWSEKWEINNGILFFVAMSDKKIRITVSNNLKGKLSESAALDIMKNTLNPGFVKNKYFESFDLALDEISKHLNGYYQGYSRYSPNYDHRLDVKWYEFHKYDLVSLIMLIVFALAFNIYVYLSYLSLPFGLNLLTQLFWHCLGSLNLFFYTILIVKNMTMTYESYFLHCLLGVCQLLIFGFSFKWQGALKYCLLNSIIFISIWLSSSSIFYLISSKEILIYNDFWPILYCGFLAAVLFSIFFLFFKTYIKARLKRN